MPHHLIAVAGLPGSGKSHYVYRLAREHGYAAFSDITQDDWRRWPELVEALRTRTGIIDSATFTDQAGRDVLAARVARLNWPVSIEWRFFEADPSAALTNILRDVLRKPDREAVNRIRSFFRRAPGYAVPEGFAPIPVHQEEHGSPRVEVVLL